MQEMMYGEEMNKLFLNQFKYKAPYLYRSFFSTLPFCGVDPTSACILHRQNDRECGAQHCLFEALSVTGYFDRAKQN